ncbi:LysR substrate-binding domain-containing protein [Streptomyces sp. MS06]|uniref:LysR substrate-binding domain-containing protein n=1 Tax=Streptomyces sp. MS06 TaxID=3385974 RepID=UPI0039A0D6FA
MAEAVGGRGLLCGTCAPSAVPDRPGPVSRASRRGSLATGLHRTRRAVPPAALVIAVKPGTGSGLLADLLRAHHADAEMFFTHDQPAALRDGTADVALLCADTDDLDGLDTVEVGEERAVALLPAGHRLAGRPAVTTRELAVEEPFTAQCPAVALDEIVDRVALGRLITIVGSSAADRLGRSAVAVPVTDRPATRLVLGRPDGASHAPTAAFVATALALTADRPGTHR